MEKSAVIFIGIQASGKSTFYRTYLSNTHVHINLDTLKTRLREQETIQSCFTNGRSFAIDNTNPTREDRARYIIPAKAEGYRLIGYFFESRVKECIARNQTREGKACVPSCAIAATSNKLELPSFDEGFDELYFVRISSDEFSVEEWRK